MRALGLGPIREADEAPEDYERLEEGSRAFSELILPEMLASCMAPREPVRSWQLDALALTSPGGETDAGSTRSWRPRAGDVTAMVQASVSHVGGRDPAAPADATPGRLITQIEAGELGVIDLVVERTSQGLKITIGVDNAVTAASAELERALLEQSLRASGLTLLSVTILQTSENGTLLAQPRFVRRSNGFDAPNQDKSETGTGPDRTARSHKRLNLTG